MSIPNLVEAFIRAHLEWRRLCVLSEVTSPQGSRFHCLRAALFRFEGEVIDELWILGDLVGRDATLQSSAKSLQPTTYEAVRVSFLRARTWDLRFSCTLTFVNCFQT